MKSSSYPSLGQTVGYVRQDPATAKIVTGFGTILSICMDPNKRPMVFMEGDVDHPNEQGELVTEKGKFTVHVSCLEPTPEFIDKYERANKRILEIGAEGNGKVTETVAEYNKMVDQVQSEFLGEPINFD